MNAERCVKVSLAERSYDIVIGAGLLAQVGARVAALGYGGKAAVVTDRNVGRLYATKVGRSLKAAGFEVRTIVVPAGERSKTLSWVTRILDELARARFERASVLVALGGGVIGDLTGFAAAIYARGIPFVQVPTTLVAQVDSSVGGKTGVNHPMAKNLIGSFHQPRCVLIDPTTLKTLPGREWTAGLAEVIKYGMIEDERFFGFLETRMEVLLRKDEEPVAHVLMRSCEIKAQVVGEDEREADRRRILNYGHTVGHALEAIGRYRTLVHGEAVAIGMVQEADLAHHLGICDGDVPARQRALVRRAGLPDAVPARVRFPDLWTAMQHDKKVSGGRIQCVVPERVGRVRIVSLERRDVQDWFGRRGDGVVTR